MPRVASRDQTSSVEGSGIAIGYVDACRTSIDLHRRGADLGGAGLIGPVLDTVVASTRNVVKLGSIKVAGVMN
jgi:hypothetical protein